MTEYEESRDYVFKCWRPNGQVADRFTFYGPFGAGYELARRRSELCDAPVITWTLR